MRTTLLTFITLFSLTFILPAHVQAQTSDCGTVLFKQIIEKVDSLNEGVYAVQQDLWEIEKMYTLEREVAVEGSYQIARISREVSPELYSDPEYVKLKAEEKIARSAYADFVVPIIAKSQNIAELLYFYEGGTDDSFLIEEVIKNKTFQNFNQTVTAQINYKVHIDSAMVKDIVRTPRGYSGFWEKDTMILEITKTFVLETLKPLTKYSATEIWWIIRSLKEYDSNSDAYFTDTISAETKKSLRKKVERCWLVEEIYSHSDMFLDTDN